VVIAALDLGDGVACMHLHAGTLEAGVDLRSEFRVDRGEDLG